MARIYVSSTFSDLVDYRKGVGQVIRRLGHEDVSMEYYVAEDRRPLDRCLADVASSDVYVGIFAFRYGYIPEVGNPDQLSITELEYRCAMDTGKSCLIFLASDASWPVAKMEFGAIDRIRTLRDKLLEGHTVSIFENADDLARKVNEAVVGWEKRIGPTGKSGTIFLSYRREETASYARLLQLTLRDDLPHVQVFMDLDSIKAGLDFADVIREAIDSCSVLLAVIGPKWATLADEEGNRRLDNPDDFVRFEIQAALERGVRVIPVLVDGARPPRREQLPSELQQLARLNAHELSSQRYDYDAGQLLATIRQVLDPASGGSRRLSLP